MKIKELREYISHLDNLLPVLIKHFQISDPHKLFGIKITLQQYFALNILAKKDSCIVTELSKILGIALSTTTELTNRLVKKGFIEKIRNKNDRRIIWIKLTNKGLDIIQKFNKEKQRHISSILKRLNQRDCHAIIDMLKIVSQVIKTAEI